MDKQLLQTCMPGLDDTAYERFCLYYARLTETNRVMNLTAITEEQEVASKHFADSLAALPYLNRNAAVIDVGTGAGFPGVPLLWKGCSRNWGFPPPLSTAGRRNWGRTGSIGKSLILPFPGRWPICRCCWSLPLPL